MLIQQPYFTTTWVSWHQKRKSFYIIVKQEMTAWHWHELDLL